MHGSLFHPEEVELARALPTGLIQWDLYLQMSLHTNYSGYGKILLLVMKENSG